MQSPLIDRDIFFGNPEITSPKLSPDGQYITFMKQYNGILNLWIKKFDQAFEQAIPLTASERPSYGYFWTYDSSRILFLIDKGGDENVNLFKINIIDIDWQANAPMPTSINLTPYDQVQTQVIDVSRQNPSRIKVGLNIRDKAWHDLYSLNLESGELTLIYENSDRTTGYEFDWDEQLRMLYKTDQNGTTEFILLLPESDTKTIYKSLVTESAGVVGWTPDNKQIFVSTNVGSFDKTSLIKINLDDLTTTFIEDDPNKQVDLGGVSFNINTRALINTSYTLHKTEYNWKDNKRAIEYDFLQSKFPNREVSFLSHTLDYNKYLVAVGGDRFASDVYLFDTESMGLTFQFTPRPKLKEVEEHLSVMTPISYESSDGLVIPAYLSVPKGSGGKIMPAVILVHGGPKGPRDYWGYHPEVQYLTNRGYVVLQPNFRASGGFGKEYLNAGDLQWGRLMQDDITYGVKYLIDQQIADPNLIAIMGGSYGGYATLAGLTFTPDLYACGVDIVGPSNIFTLLESIPPYWEAGRAFLYGMVGDPATEGGQALIKASSPLFFVDNILKPLLIIQGANDPRVKQAESDQIVEALKNKGKKVEYLLAKDEGHGFAKPLNRKAMYAYVEKFLAETIGGRYQEDMEEDVKQTLDIIRQEL
jgi:dipeptidyl aminopeptidase/acylaminoacyl peptidase